MATKIRTVKIEKNRAMQGQRDMRKTNRELTLKLKQQEALIQELQNTKPDWVVNDLGELGVRIHGHCYFCYKGDSLEYQTPKHGDGTPMLYRLVGKREFGETVWPMKWINNGLRTARYKEELEWVEGLSFGKQDDPDIHWNPLPTYKEEES